MIPDQVATISAMLARYWAMVEAEEAGPSIPERRSQMLALGGYLRVHHPATLVEAERQWRSMKERGVAGATAPPLSAADGQVEKAPESSPEPRYIDPHLGEKLRGQLFTALVHVRGQK